MKVSRNKMDFDTDPEWPSNDYCDNAKPDFPDTIDTVYPVFMPFEHKGIRFGGAFQFYLILFQVSGERMYPS